MKFTNRSQRGLFIGMNVALLLMCLSSQRAIRGQDASTVAPPPSTLPAGAKLVNSLSSKGVQVYRRDQNLWLLLDPAALTGKRATIPRLCAPIRSLGWKDHADYKVEFLPEPTTWVLSWKTPPSSTPVLEIVFDASPELPEECPLPRPAADGSVFLPACLASTFGDKLRYEPQWFKNTVGYWTVPSDYATWEFTIEQPGTFSVAVLQGCGEGQGGSDAAMTIRQGEQMTAELAFKTIDTGHFQNFRWNHLGEISIPENGKYQLRIDAKRIARAALFDVRAVHLVRQAKRK